MNTTKKCFTRGRVLLSAAVLLLILALLAFDRRLLVRRYTLETEEITAPIRIALVTDLHSCYYGKNQSRLIDAIDEQMPDLILLGGDIFDDVADDENTALFLAAAAERYPCYYVTGNHECWADREKFSRQMAILREYGIPVLSGDAQMLALGGETVYLCGVDDPEIYRTRYSKEEDLQSYRDAQVQSEQVLLDSVASLSASIPDRTFSLLLSHRPEYFDRYAETAFDLVLCGHAHGGQWRIPFLLNGVYAPNQGVFPSYAGGRYDKNSTTMIVSRGLARETTWVPRIFNRPELVIIDIT